MNEHVALRLTPTVGMLEPGGEARWEAVVRNRASVVDRIELQMLGQAADWAVIEPSSVSLFPDEERLVHVILRPPRAFDLKPGPMQIGVRARSCTDSERSTVEEATLTIGAFQDLVAELQPGTTKARFVGRHRVRLYSRGNEPVHVTTVAAGPDGALNLWVAPGSVSVGPDEVRRVRLQARPRHTIWAGALQAHTFEVRVTPVNGDVKRLPGVMLQRPVATRAMAMLAIGLIAVGSVAIAYKWGALGGLRALPAISGAPDRLATPGSQPANGAGASPSPATVPSPGNAAAGTASPPAGLGSVPGSQTRPTATPTAAPLPATPAWTQLSATGPPPSARTDASAVLNVVANRMVLFAGNPVGCSFTPSLNDTWLLTNANGQGGTPSWSQLSPSGAAPGVRRGQTAVYNPASDRMIVFGGDPVGCAVNKYNDVWALTNATGSSGGQPSWAQLAPAGGPPPGRSDHTAVYDPGTNRMVIFGGFGPQGDLADVWVLTNADGTGGSAQWVQLQPTGGPPPGDELHTAVYDPASNRMIVFGGRKTCCGGPTSNQPWVLTNANGLGGPPQWFQLGAAGTPPSPRFGSVSAYEPSANRMIVFGGATGAGQVNDVWLLTNANGLNGTPRWVQIPQGGVDPAPRGGEVAVPASVYDGPDDRLVVFGGKTQGGVANDTWVLSAASASTSG